MAEGCKCNWKQCRKNCECRCHVAAEAYARHYNDLGVSTGFEQAGNLLLKQAADAFTKGRDEEAKMLRFWSESFLIKAKESHPGPEIKYDEEA